MRKIRDRLIEVALDLAEAKRQLKSERKTLKRGRTSGINKKNVRRQIKTLKSGIKVTKKELEGLCGQLLRDRYKTQRS